MEEGNGGVPGESSSPFQNKRFGDFEVLKPIGKGKFAVVYRAKRVQDDEIVALKRINVDSIDDKSREKCLKEVRLLQSLDHPNIIRYLDSFITDNDLVIVFEWAAAGDLKRQLRKAQERGVGFEERVIWKYFSQICDAIQHMHERRIMHRDLKPANIFLTLDGTVKVGDLGLSRELSEHTVQAHSKVGTPLYMSPEVLRGDGYDFKSDIWSLGCLLYELAMLKSPFKSEGLNLYLLFQKISLGDYQPLPENYSEELRSLSYSMISTKREDRPEIGAVCAQARKMRAFFNDKNASMKRAALTAGGAGAAGAGGHSSADNPPSSSSSSGNTASATDTNTNKQSNTAPALLSDAKSSQPSQPPSSSSSSDKRFHSNSRSDEKAEDRSDAKHDGRHREGGGASREGGSRHTLRDARFEEDKFGEGEAEGEGSGSALATERSDERTLDRASSRDKERERAGRGAEGKSDGPWGRTNTNTNTNMGSEQDDRAHTPELARTANANTNANMSSNTYARTMQNFGYGDPPSYASTNINTSASANNPKPKLSPPPVTHRPKPTAPAPRYANANTNAQPGTSKSNTNTNTNTNTYTNTYTNTNTNTDFNLGPEEDTDTPTGTDRSSALGSSSVAFALMEVVYDHLVVLGYEMEEAGSGKTRQPSGKGRLLPMHFACEPSLLGVVAGYGGRHVLQFRRFVDVSLWLLNKATAGSGAGAGAGATFLFRLDREKDSPVMIAKQLLSAAQASGVPSERLAEITPTALATGYGEKVCQFLLAITDRALAAVGADKLTLLYQDSDSSSSTGANGYGGMEAQGGGKDGNNDADIEDNEDDQAVEEDGWNNNTRDEASHSHDGFHDTSISNTSAADNSQILQHGVMHAAIDAKLWQAETERVSVQLALAARGKGIAGNGASGLGGLAGLGGGWSEHLQTMQKVVSDCYSFNTSSNSGSGSGSGSGNSNGRTSAAAGGGAESDSKFAFIVSSLAALDSMVKTDLAAISRCEGLLNSRSSLAPLSAEYSQHSRAFNEISSAQTVKSGSLRELSDALAVLEEKLTDASERYEGKNSGSEGQGQAQMLREGIKRLKQETNVMALTTGLLEATLMTKRMASSKASRLKRAGGRGRGGTKSTNGIPRTPGDVGDDDEYALF